MTRKCNKCGEEFELTPTHKGLSTICSPQCGLEQINPDTVERKARQEAEADKARREAALETLKTKTLLHNLSRKEQARRGVVYLTFTRARKLQVEDVIEVNRGGKITREIVTGVEVGRNIVVVYTNRYTTKTIEFYRTTEQFDASTGEELDVLMKMKRK